MRRALAASAMVHVAVLGGLLALAHPRFQASPAMRVALVGQPGTAAGQSHETAGGTHPGVAPVEHPSPVADPSPAAPARPPPARSSTRAARPVETPASGANGSSDGAASGAEALVSAVQSDVWVLAGPGRTTARGGGRSGSSPEVVGAASGAGTAATATAGTRGPTGGDGTEVEAAGTGGQSSASLLAALSQRLAASAARCAPAEVVRTVRHAVPEVPLHFCLDAAGRPSEVGLLGTTGSDVLDRAARDCVVPGALPLPPVPGCYTVEVRFPSRG